MSREPDWGKLRQIGTEVEDLVDSGAWSREHFDRLLAAAKEACAGQEELLEFICNEAPKEWLE